MQDEIARLQEELNKIEQAIAGEEALGGVSEAPEENARLASLQQKAKELRAKIAVTGNVSDSNLVIGDGNLISKIINIFSGSTEEQRNQRNRQIMLKRVKEFWVEGVLEHSLHGQVLIELGMEDRPDAVDNRPWDMVLQTPERPPRLLPRGTKILQVFDEMDQALLILGEPGSGKTTMLLELARDTIACAENDPIQPIPVVFNLSSWANSKQPIAEWLIDELNSKYTIPHQIGRFWVENHELLLLLDGLDEVALERREACVKAINQFRLKHLMGLVVCSRIADYEAQDTQLKLQGAVLLEPLTLEQIDNYLVKIGLELLAVRKTLEHDLTLQELAQLPLMLSIMVLAYRGMSTRQLKQFKTVDDRRQHIFQTYVERMFERKGKKGPPYPKEQTKMWLSWLAWNMQRHNQKEFLIEGLQPSWLIKRRWRWSYVLASHLLAIVIFWLILGLILGLIDGLILGLTLGIAIGIINLLHFQLPSQEFKIAPSFVWKTFNIMTVGAITLLVLVVIEQLISVGSSMRELITGVTNQLAYAVVFIFIFGLKEKSLASDIQTVEALNWSWRKALNDGYFFALTTAFLFSLINELITGWSHELKNMFIYTIGWFYLLFPTFAIFNGFRNLVVEKKIYPNQGIHLSIKNSIFGVMIVSISTTLVFMLFFALVNRVSDQQDIKPIYGLFFGLKYGLIACLWYGGFDVIKHCILRAILIMQGHTPRNYADFLDDAAKLIFLQKVGGGYIFIHRLLQEHFAAMGDEEA